MTAFNDMFTGVEDRARLLTEILRQCQATPGTTLIAYVDRATLEVFATRSLPTPDPVIDAASYFDEGAILRLSASLRAIAVDMVPKRNWTGRAGSDITGELVTVVCREGGAEITPVEGQYHWGWRYSNHLTTALDGEIFAVTPQGWANLYGEWSSETPALVASVEALVTAPEVQAAEALLADLSVATFSPSPRECLLCYVYRMMSEFGCNGRLRFASHYRDVRAPLATGLERRLGKMGGYCDCEIFLNGYDLQAEYWVPEETDDPYDPDEPDDSWGDEEQTWPEPLPACTGVRAGSTQPCRLWWRRRRW